jgi:hypothetical protein
MSYGSWVVCLCPCTGCLPVSPQRSFACLSHSGRSRPLLYRPFPVYVGNLDNQYECQPPVECSAQRTRRLSRGTSSKTYEVLCTTVSVPFMRNRGSGMLRRACCALDPLGCWGACGAPDCRIHNGPLPPSTRPPRPPRPVPA